MPMPFHSSKAPCRSADLNALPQSAYQWSNQLYEKTTGLLLLPGLLERSPDH
jgi:hypothetical protein